MFTRVVFAVAGLYGLGELIALSQLPGSFTYYGLVATLAAWQILFLMIAWRPAELRVAMIAAVCEKLFWVVTLAVLHQRGALSDRELAGNTIPHALLGVLFVVAYFRTSRHVTQAPAD
jgi:hypothetical protein